MGTGQKPPIMMKSKMCFFKHLQGSHYFQIRERSDLSFRELTGRSGETSGKSQLRLIETLFHYPSDVTLPKLKK